MPRYRGPSEYRGLATTAATLAVEGPPACPIRRVREGPGIEKMHVTGGHPSVSVQVPATTPWNQRFAPRASVCPGARATLAADDRRAVARSARPVPAWCIGTAWALRPSPAALPLTVSAFAIACLRNSLGTVHECRLARVAAAGDMATGYRVCLDAAVRPRSGARRAAADGSEGPRSRLTQRLGATRRDHLALRVRDAPCLQSSPACSGCLQAPPRQ